MMSLTKRTHWILRFLCLMTFSIAAEPADAQTSLRGQVIDASTQKPVAYACLFFTQKSIGTYTDRKGYFALQPENEEDSLAIQSMGYQDTFIRVGDLMQQAPMPIIQLAPADQELGAVMVRFGKTRKKVIGNTTTQGFIATSPCGQSHGDQIGLRIKLRKREKAQLLSFHFALAYSACDTTRFLLHFYQINDPGELGERIGEQPIPIATTQRTGVVTVDLTAYQISADQSFLAVLEWPANGCFAKAGGVAFVASPVWTGYHRSAGQAEWQTLPIAGPGFWVEVAATKVSR